MTLPSIALQLAEFKRDYLRSKYSHTRMSTREEAIRKMLEILDGRNMTARMIAKEMDLSYRTVGDYLQETTRSGKTKRWMAKNFAWFTLSDAERERLNKEK